MKLQIIFFIGIFFHSFTLQAEECSRRCEEKLAKENAQADNTCKKFSQKCEDYKQDAENYSKCLTHVEQIRKKMFARAQVNYELCLGTC